MIGTVALVAILASLLLPLVVRQTDKIVADQEVATLKTFRDAFQGYILANRVIPDQTTWYSAIAGKLGFGTNDVLYNVRQQSRQQPRVFLIDPAMQMGLPTSPTGLPYSQTNYYVASASVSTPMLPINPRVMIVSSLGSALPSTVTSGVFGNTTTHPYFVDLWNTQDGTVPSDGAWAGWIGNPGDVIVQRINLEPLFVHLVLSRYNSTSGGWYTIDGSDGTTTPLQVITSLDGYFIQNTVVALYTNNPSDQVHALDTKQILTADTSFVFEQGIWRGTLTGQSVGNGAAGAGDVVQQFLNATPNANAQYPYPANTNYQQILVASDMLTYMSNYNVWAFTNNFDKNSAVYRFLKNFEPTMISDIQGLYQLNAGGGNSYYPTNPYAVNCP